MVRPPIWQCTSSELPGLLADKLLANDPVGARPC
jgi:hypothetical protein